MYKNIDTCKKTVFKMSNNLLTKIGLGSKENTLLSLEQKNKVVISVHPETNRPLKLWSKLQNKQKSSKVQSLNPETPVTEENVRFVCISDTHAKLEKRKGNIIPNGDVLIHAGDITNVGHPNEVAAFNEYLGNLPHKHKIVIAGNHDLTFDEDLLYNRPDHLHMFGMRKKMVMDYLESAEVNSVQELLTNCVYLQDASVDLYGIKIHGSPWQPEFGDWGFNLPRGEQCLEKWNMIPCDTDILITHGPPLGHGDKCFDGNRAGCVELLSTIQERVQPKYHVFGHIHEGYGCTTDGITTYINASTCTLQYKATNPPIVFDFPIPSGHTKEEAIGQICCYDLSDPKSKKGEDKMAEDEDCIVFAE